MMGESGNVGGSETYNCGGRTDNLVTRSLKIENIPVIADYYLQ
jgi:hypothetical protein